MSTRIKLFTSVCFFSLYGCYLPVGFEEDNWIIPSDSIDSIVKGQPIPKRILNLKGSEVSIFFNSDVCPCSKRRMLQLKVSEVSSKSLTGYERSSYDYFANFPRICKNYAEARTTIDQAFSLAGKSSTYQSRYYYHRPSFELIWDAVRVADPPECDIEQGKFLAEAALQLARESGAKTENSNNILKVRENWISRKSAIEINWKQIDTISVWSKNVEWGWFFPTTFGP